MMGGKKEHREVERRGSGGKGVGSSEMMEERRNIRNWREGRG